MKNYKTTNAFTMIELIFVIVILGILSAVAIPRFMTFSEITEDAMVKAFAGTLTRTVGHSFWSASITSSHLGSITYDSDSAKFNDKPLKAYVDNYPKYLDETTTNFHNCVNSGVANPFIAHTAEYRLNIFCRDGNKTSAPLFVADVNNTHAF